MTVHHPPASVSSERDTNVFSISDANLAQRYQFIREIGAGNWGCVWLCSPKTDEHRAQVHGDETPRRVAVKLVFREKKPNTAQRVRSLWNEMKIVRALKQEPHPSIIPFHSFIITPSFAIITMEYLPYLIPVEVPEIKAREWFHSLLSAVHFLHTRGVVHNDIKPANILLSTRKIPMFVDFGFAEKYEVGSKRAFMSNLAYGTPEYLSPERARGTVHDTRKSDMWSLGITFFEILIGRTPFEYIEGEKLTTPADLERYWSRTAKGKWVGTWSMSKAAEGLLRRMICPNVDTRCTAAEAILDPYWMEDIDTISLSPKNSLMTMSSPAPGMTPDRVRKMGVKPMSPKENMRPLVAKRSNLSEASDKTKSVTRPPRRVYSHALPTIEGSPISARTAGGRENIPPSPYRSRVAIAKARPSVKRKPVPAFDENMSPFRIKVKDVASQTPTKGTDAHKRRSGVLTDATSRVHNIGTPRRPATSPVGKAEKGRDKVPEKGRQFGSGSYDRVKAFERLKQLERNRFLEEEEDEEAGSDEPPREKAPQEKEKERDQDCVQEVVVPPKPSSQCMTSTSLAAISTVTRVDYNNTPARNFARRDTTPSSFTLMTDFKSTLVDRRVLEEPAEHDSKTILMNSLPVSRHQASPSLLKHGIKASIDYVDKTFGLYKLSIGRMNIRKPAKRTSEDLDASDSHRASWEDYSFITDPKTSIPISRHPLHSDQVVADNKADRLSQWIRSVEQVVKEAKENFASSSITAPPPLTAPPASRAGVARAPRTQRKILAADQIFQEPEARSTSPAEPSGRQTPPPNRGLGTTAEPPLPPKDLSSPRSRRRATISSGPGLAAKIETASIDGTPSRRKEKSKSAGNLSSLVRPISPLSQLQKALEKEEESKRNLSELLDRSIFIARPSGSTPPGDNDLVSPGSPRPQAQIRLSSSLNPAKSPAVSTVLRESNSSPILYSRPQSKQESLPDRVPLVKTGIKPRRVSKSQISAPTPVQAPPTLQAPPSASKKTSRLFGSRQGRVSHHQSYSDDLTVSHPAGTRSGAEDFGLLSSMSFSQSASLTKDASKSVSAVRKAFKAIVSGRSAARRQQQQQQHLQPQQRTVPV
ncbi:hypothetical protein ACEPAF_9821 [Sanghuangporus sanghuang]